MLWILAIVHLTLWVSSVHAFYPWFPEWLCRDHHICSSTGASDAGAVGGVKRAEADQEPPSTSNAEPVTFGLFRKATGVEVRESAPSRAARAAYRLARKYVRPQATRTAAAEKRGQNAFTVLSAVAPSQTNSVGIDQDGTDFSYFISVEFGSSQKSLYMLLDSGAGTTWVMGSSCQSAACTMHTTYGPSDSTTLSETGQTFSIAYGSGTVSGNLVQDSIAVAGITVDLSFGLANITSDDFTHFPFDGILGLAMSHGQTDNFVNVVKTDGLLRSNVYGVYLTRAAESPNDGEITFGGTDPAKYDGDIAYTSVSGQAAGDWAIPMDGIGYGGQSAGITGRTAYIDTGTSYVFGPPDDVATLHKLIPGANSSDGFTYTVPCGAGTTFAPVMVTFSGVAYAISPVDYLSTPSSSGTCTSNIYGQQIVQGAWLFGDTYLKNVYAVFDVDQTRIGFATRPDSLTGSTAMASASATRASPSPAASGQTSSMSTMTNPAAASSSADAGIPGLNGHETAAATTGPAASVTGAAASATANPKSPGVQLKRNKYVQVVCSIVALIAAAVV